MIFPSFLVWSKTVSGPLMNNQKRFIEIFQFRKDIHEICVSAQSLTTLTRCQRSGCLCGQGVSVVIDYANTMLQIVNQETRCCKLDSRNCLRRLVKCGARVSHRTEHVAELVKPLPVCGTLMSHTLRIPETFYKKHIQNA